MAGAVFQNSYYIANAINAILYGESRFSPFYVRPLMRGAG